LAAVYLDPLGRYRSCSHPPQFQLDKKTKSSLFIRASHQEISGVFHIERRRLSRAGDAAANVLVGSLLWADGSLSFNQFNVDEKSQPIKVFFVKLPTH
jgi:hypothetical protein